jgi:mono/diheme cytochrome c family protein
MRTTIITLLFAVTAATACSNADSGKKEEPKTDAAADPATDAKAAGDAAAPEAFVPDPNADTSLPGDPVKGEEVYKRVCLACHGADGKGNGGMTGADFVKDKTRLAKDNKVLIKSVTEGVLKVPPGKPVMPAQGGSLSEDEIKDAIAYIRKTFGE